MGDSFAELVERAQPTTTSVEIVLSDHGAEIDRLEAEMLSIARADEKTNTPDRAPQIARQIADLEAQADRQTFELCSIGNRGWRDLVAGHPPTPEQRRDGLDHNPDTFQHAALAASIISPPGATSEMIAVLEDRLSGGRWAKLWQACLQVNRGGDRPKSLTASAVRAATEPS
jgi:hypothetical protein